MVGYVLNFPKCVLGVVGCSNLHSASSQAHWARKLTWFRAESLRLLTGRISRKFWIFQKSHNKTQEARVCAGSAVSSPKIDRQILGTRRFTKVNTVLSCAPSTQFHLCTDVRYHLMHCFSRLFQLRCTVFHVFFKIAVHWKELASSNSLQQRRN